MAITVNNCTKDQLKRLATLLAEWSQPGCCLALRGEIGTGKTTFSRFFLQSLIPSLTTVPSPTFTLVQSYSCFKGDIWHCDLYRLKNPEDSLELGLDEATSTAICLIEWPHKMGGYLPEKRVDIGFQIDSETTRNITIQLTGYSGDALILAVSTAFKI